VHADIAGGEHEWKEVIIGLAAGCCIALLVASVAAVLLTRRHLWDGFRGYEKVESEEVQLAAPGLSNRALRQVRCEVCNFIFP